VRTAKRAIPVFLGIVIIVAAAFPFGSLTAHSHWEKVGWVPFVSPPLKAVDVVGNVLLGVPAGLGLAARYAAGPSIAGVVVGAVSFLCEWAQVYSHRRFPSATDLVCNVGGAMAASAWWASRRRIAKSG
jgi:hypothetical protein